MNTIEEKRRTRIDGLAHNALGKIIEIMHDEYNVPKDEKLFYEFLNTFRKALRKFKNAKNGIPNDEWQKMFPKSKRTEIALLDFKSVISIMKTCCEPSDNHQRLLDKFPELRNSNAHLGLVEDFEKRIEQYSEYLLELGCPKDEVNVIIKRARHVNPENLEFGLTDVISNFDGRDDDLLGLHQLFSNGNKRVVISGLSGCGKSEFARAYCRKFKSHYNNNVIYFNAENPNAINEVLREVLQMIGLSNLIKGKVLTTKVMLERMYDYLSLVNHLLVFDNVKNFAEIGRYHLPKDKYEGNILITTQYTQWNKPFYHLKLSVLTVEAVVDILKAEYSEEATEIYEELAEQIGCLPLALQLVVAYRKGTGASASKCVEMFKTSYDKVMVPDPENHDLNTDKTIRATYQMALDQVKLNLTATRIAFIMSMIDGKSISQTFLQKLDDVEPQAMLEARSSLSEYSLVQFDENNQNMSIHPLLQVVIQEDMNATEKQRAVNDVITMCRNAVKENQNHKDLKFGDYWSNHIYRCILSNTIEMGRIDGVIDIVKASVRSLFNSNRFEDAVSFLDCWQKHFTFSNEELVYINYLKAKSCYKNNDYDECKEVMEKIVATDTLKTIDTNTQSKILYLYYYCLVASHGNIDEFKSSLCTIVWDEREIDEKCRSRIDFLKSLHTDEEIANEQKSPSTDIKSTSKFSKSTRSSSNCVVM